MYQYKGKIESVTDGDTVVITLDLGMRIFHTSVFRVYGINAPETSTSEGKKVKEYVKYVLPVGKDVLVKTYKDKKEKYGRYLAEIEYDGINLGSELISKGMAATYIL